MFGGRAAAHSDIETSTPAVDAVVGEPVDEILVVFVSAASPDADGFEVLDPQGTIRSPEVEQVDERTYILRLSPALAGGEAAVRYSMVAADGHSLTGGFAFVVDAPVPTTAVTTVPATTSPATTAPAPATTDPAPATTTESAATVPPATTEPPAAATTVAATTAAEATDDEGLGADVIGALALAAVGGFGAGFARWRWQAPGS